jgi:hypothetical protein
MKENRKLSEASAPDINSRRALLYKVPAVPVWCLEDAAAEAAWHETLRLAGLSCDTLPPPPPAGARKLAARRLSIATLASVADPGER